MKWAGFFGLILFLGVFAMKKLPRGIRNNNPGNLKELPGDKTRWVGERATDDDPIFEEFTAPEFGIRALARVLHTYYYNHGLNTVAAIINRFAPGSENDTSAYIASVAGRIGVDPVRPFPFDEKVVDLVTAIIIHENGVNPYSRDFIAEGIELAWA